MNKQRILIISFFVVLLLSAFSGGKTGVGKIVSCNVDPSIISGVQSGDLVLRCGRGFISNAMRNFSIQEKKYSHAGIAVIENGKVFVCHMLGDEVEDSMSDFLKEPFELFCSPNGNSSFAVYRYKLSREQKTQFIKSLEELSSKKIPFDAQFDLESDEKLYCTELIYKCLQKSSNNSNYLPLSRIGNRSYVAIDNLYLNNHCKKIASFSNK